MSNSWCFPCLLMTIHLRGCGHIRFFENSSFTQINNTCTCKVQASLHPSNLNSARSRLQHTPPSQSHPKRHQQSSWNRRFNVMLLTIHPHQPSYDRARADKPVEIQGRSIVSQYRRLIALQSARTSPEIHHSLFRIYYITTEPPSDVAVIIHSF